MAQRPECLLVTDEASIFSDNNLLGFMHCLVVGHDVDLVVESGSVGQHLLRVVLLGSNTHCKRTTSTCSGFKNFHSFDRKGLMISIASCELKLFGLSGVDGFLFSSDMMCCYIKTKKIKHIKGCVE